jgi:hypothetical protein
MVLPYTEARTGNNEVVRTFSEDIDPIELMWHRDDEDRIVEAVGKTDWLIQLDDELPRLLTDRIDIPRHEWHRLIKGTGDLTVRIIKK